MVLTHTLSGGHMTGGVLDSVSKTAHLAWWALLLRGLLSVAVGVFIFARPMDSVAAFALVIALWALFTGFTSIVHAFELRPMMKHWWVLLLSGLVVADDHGRDRDLRRDARKADGHAVGLDRGIRRIERGRGRICADRPTHHACSDHRIDRRLCVARRRGAADGRVQAAVTRAVVTHGGTGGGASLGVFRLSPRRVAQHSVGESGTWGHRESRGDSRPCDHEGVRLSLLRPGRAKRDGISAGRGAVPQPHRGCGRVRDRLARVQWLVSWRPEERDRLGLAVSAPAIQRETGDADLRVAVDGRWQPRPLGPAGAARASRRPHVSGHVLTRPGPPGVRPRRQDRQPDTRRSVG